MGPGLSIKTDLGGIVAAGAKARKIGATRLANAIDRVGPPAAWVRPACTLPDGHQ